MWPVIVPRVLVEISRDETGALVGVASVIDTDVALSIGRPDFLRSKATKAPLDIACCSLLMMLELDMSLTMRTV